MEYFMFPFIINSGSFEKAARRRQLSPSNLSNIFRIYCKFQAVAGPGHTQTNVVPSSGIRTLAWRHNPVLLTPVLLTSVLLTPVLLTPVLPSSSSCSFIVTTRHGWTPHQRYSSRIGDDRVNNHHCKCKCFWCSSNVLYFATADQCPAPRRGQSSLLHAFPHLLHSVLTPPAAASCPCSCSPEPDTWHATKTTCPGVPVLSRH